MKSWRWSRGIAPLILKHGTRLGWVEGIMPRSLYTWWSAPGTYWVGCCWAPKVVWRFDEGKNLLPLPGIKLWIVKIMAQSLYQIVRNSMSLLKIGNICSDLKISCNPTYFCYLKWIPHSKVDFQDTEDINKNVTAKLNLVCYDQHHRLLCNF